MVAEAHGELLMLSDESVTYVWAKSRWVELQLSAARYVVEYRVIPDCHQAAPRYAM